MAEIRRLTSKYSNVFYETEILSSAEELPRDCIFITALIDEITEIEYRIYKDSLGLYYAIEEE